MMELRIKNISKTYGKSKKALSNVDISLTPGIYGLLGPNGSGKSTLMNIITDNLKADRGCVYYDGDPISKLGSKYREKIGYMPTTTSTKPKALRTRWAEKSTKERRLSEQDLGPAQFFLQRFTTAWAAWKPIAKVRSSTYLATSPSPAFMLPANPPEAYTVPLDLALVPSLTA